MKYRTVSVSVGVPDDLPDEEVSQIVHDALRGYVGWPVTVERDGKTVTSRPDILGPWDRRS